MKNVLIFLICFSIFACSPSPKDINYHVDECAFCKMKISDPNFGAELVTVKGKVYKYDSGECLLREYIANGPDLYSYVLVTDYTQPNTLVDALRATYLVSENLPSPMGGNLSSYESAQVAAKFHSEKGGQLFTFDEILSEYKNTYQ